MLEFEQEQKFIGIIPNAEKPSFIPTFSKNTAFVTGPEGDFSKAEIDDALKAGYTPFALGSGILRTETAALAAAAWFSLNSRECE